MKNDHHDPNDGWHCAAAACSVMSIGKWIAVVFGALWLIGKVYNLLTQ